MKEDEDAGACGAWSAAPLFKTGVERLNGSRRKRREREEEGKKPRSCEDTDCSHSLSYITAELKLSPLPSVSATI